MPTVVRFNGYRVLIYVEDHRPAHVHVHRAGCEAVFFLNCPDGPLAVRESEGFSDREVNRIEKWLNAHIADLCAKWEEIHGDSK